MSKFIEMLFERQYEAALKTGIAFGRRQGIAIRREEVRQEGVKREKQEIARRMSELGFALDKIAKVVNTDQAIVESWINGN